MLTSREEVSATNVAKNRCHIPGTVLTLTNRKRGEIARSKAGGVVEVILGNLSGGTTNEGTIRKRLVGKNLCIRGLSARQMHTCGGVSYVRCSNVSVQHQGVCVYVCSNVIVQHSGSFMTIRDIDLLCVTWLISVSARETHVISHFCLYSAGRVRLKTRFIFALRLGLMNTLGGLSQMGIKAKFPTPPQSWMTQKVLDPPST